MMIFVLQCLFIWSLAGLAILLSHMLSFWASSSTFLLSLCIWTAQSSYINNHPEKFSNWLDTPDAFLFFSIFFFFKFFIISYLVRVVLEIKNLKLENFHE